MGRKSENTPIASVDFYYSGSDGQFNRFLKSVVRDYLSNDQISPEEETPTEQEKPS